ncbi:hypothetical protein D9M72_587160 [compost metagenome]
MRVARLHHRRGGNAVGREQLVGGDGIQPLLAGSQRGLHDGACGGGIHHEILRQAGRGFHQRRLRIAVAHQVLEPAHGLGFGRVGRHARGVEGGGGTVVVAQPHREHRLVAVVARAQAQRAGQRLCGVCR